MANISAAAVGSPRSRTGVSILECKKALEEAGGDEEKAIEILRKRGVTKAAKKADREQHEGLVFVAESEGKAAMVVLQCETDFVARDEHYRSTGQELANTLLEGGEESLRTAAEQHVPALVQKLGENISLGTNVVVTAPVVGSYVHSNAKIGVVIGLDGGSNEKAKDVAMHAAAMNPQYVSPDEVPTDAVEQEKTIWIEQLKSEGKPDEIIEKILLGKEKKFREESALMKQEFVKEPGVTIQQYLDGVDIVA